MVKNGTRLVKTRENETEAIKCKQKWSENVGKKCHVRTMCVMTKIHHRNTIKLTINKQGNAVEPVPTNYNKNTSESKFDS